MGLHLLLQELLLLERAAVAVELIQDKVGVLVVLVVVGVEVALQTHPILALPILAVVVVLLAAAGLLVQ